MSDSALEFELVMQRSDGNETRGNLNPGDMDYTENARGYHMDNQGAHIQDWVNSLPAIKDVDRPSIDNLDMGLHGNASIVHDDAHNRHGHTRSITIIPDTFNGEDDWDQYISHFENCAELGHWTERERALTLAACLKGQARVFYSSLASRDGYNYGSLVARLEQRFGSAKQHIRWLSRLQSRERMPHESISAFGDDVRLMTQRAYPSLDSCAKEMLALQHFYNAMTAEMRFRLIDRGVKSISEAVELVERYEEVLGSNNYGGRQGDVVRSVGRTPRNQSTKSTVTLKSGFEEKLMAIVGRLERLEKRKYTHQDNKHSRNNVDTNCFRCNSPSHMYRNCPNRQGTDRPDTGLRDKPLF